MSQYACWLHALLLTMVANPCLTQMWQPKTLFTRWANDILYHRIEHHVIIECDVIIEHHMIERHMINITWSTSHDRHHMIVCKKKCLFFFHCSVSGSIKEPISWKPDAQKGVERLELTGSLSSLLQLPKWINDSSGSNSLHPSPKRQRRSGSSEDVSASEYILLNCQPGAKEGRKRGRAEASRDWRDHSCGWGGGEWMRRWVDD